MKILIIFGNRSEAMKITSEERELEKLHHVDACVTALHHEMLDKVLYLQ